MARNVNANANELLRGVGRRLKVETTVGKGIFELRDQRKANADEMRGKLSHVGEYLEVGDYTDAMRVLKEAARKVRALAAKDITK